MCRVRKFSMLRMGDGSHAERRCQLSSIPRRSSSGRYCPLHIPKIPPQHVKYPNGYDIPVVPLLVVLILKVQGWRDHRRSGKKRFRAKIPQDIEDIRQLLDMADDAGDRLNDLDDWSPRWFLKRAESLVKRYTNHFEETTCLFRDLGFDV